MVGICESGIHTRLVIHIRLLTSTTERLTILTLHRQLTIPTPHLRKNTMGQVLMTSTHDPRDIQGRGWSMIILWIRRLHQEDRRGHTIKILTTHSSPMLYSGKIEATATAHLTGIRFTRLKTTMIRTASTMTMEEGGTRSQWRQIGENVSGSLATVPRQGV